VPAFGCAFSDELEHQLAERAVVGLEQVADLGRTGRVKEPASTICPALSDSPQGASLLASQAMPMAGSPCTPAARPVSSTAPFWRRMAPTHGRSVARASARPAPTTMPALAALSLMVSNTLRITLVWRSNCSMRESMISIAGVR